MGKNQTIYGLHSVEAALLNHKRINDELIISENHRIFSEKHQYKYRINQYNTTRQRNKICLNWVQPQSVLSQ